MTLAERRVKGELRAIADGKEGEKFVALMPLDPTDLFKLRGVIMAPPGSPMEGYILFLDITIPEGYPFEAPNVRFKNKVWHPKIRERDGRICSITLMHEWRSEFKLENLLVAFQFMLSDPGEIDPSAFDHGYNPTFSPYNKTACQQYLYDRATYEKTSKRQTEEDNEGYGYVVFSDIRISAIKSILKIPGVMNYKGCAFCKKVSERSWKLILVVLPNLALYWDRAEPKFRECKKLTTFNFTFDKEEITFDFGDGMTRDQCWKITSLSSQKIKKEETISDPRTTQPATCELELSWVRPEIKPARFIHRLTINGPEHSFDVCVDPDSFSDVSTHRKMSPTDRPTLVELRKFPVKDGKGHVDIIKEIGTNCKKFGVLLLNDETGNKVNIIESHYKEDLECINHEILRGWLSGQGKQPVTWKTLLEVLHDSCLHSLAEDIEATFTRSLV